MTRPLTQMLFFVTIVKQGVLWSSSRNRYTQSVPPYEIPDWLKIKSKNLNKMSS